MPAMPSVQGLFAVSAALFVGGIGFIIAGERTAQHSAPAAAYHAPIAPVASIKQIMNGIVMPNADVVYKAVGLDVIGRRVRRHRAEKRPGVGRRCRQRRGHRGVRQPAPHGRPRRRRWRVGEDDADVHRRRQGGAEGGRGQDSRTVSLWRAAISTRPVMSVMSGTSAAKRAPSQRWRRRRSCSSSASAGLDAHGVSGKDALFLQSIQGARHRSAHVSRRQAHGHRLRPSGVPGRRHLLSVPPEGHRAIRQPLHDRSQRHAAGRRARRHSRESVHHRRDHRVLGRLQGVRQHGRVPALLRLPAEYARRGPDLRAVPRLRPGHQASGILAVAERVSSPTS